LGHRWIDRQPATDRGLG